MKTGSFRLICLGLLSAAFFIVTDPRVSGRLNRSGSPQSNRIDAAHDALPATLVGIAGSGVVVLAGLWLATRRLN
jgi:hypothetical protein